MAKKIAKNCEETGYWHTHGNYSKRDGTPTTKENDYFNSNDFSPDDKNAAKLSGQGKTEYRGYVGTPSGVFKEYNSKNGITYKL